jgi:alginate O-acetyltransferase complex protein AlgJ
MRLAHGTTFHARLSQQLLSCLFVLVLIVPALGTTVNWTELWHNDPGEKLADCPSRPLTFQALANWPGAARRCFTDRFAFRGDFIRLDSWIHLRALGVSSSSRVILGSEHWLFYSGEDGINDFRGTRPLSSDELSRWAEALNAWSRALSGRGIALLLVIPPNKATIYADFVPPWMMRVGPSRLEQLLPVAQNIPDLLTADLLSALRSARTSGRPLYLRTDTHWNGIGAYEGYRVVAAQLARRFPDVVVPPPADQLTVQPAAPRKSGDLARMMRLEEDLEEDLSADVTPNVPRQAEIYVQAFTTTGEDKPRHVSTRSGASVARAVIFRDSFSEAMEPWLAELFGRAVFAWTPNLNMALIDQEQPDVVILEFVERRLMNFILSPPGSNNLRRGMHP